MMICNSFSHSPLSVLCSVPSRHHHLPVLSCSLMEGRSKFLEFPFVSISHENLMRDTFSMLDNRLQSQLLPCSLPSDIQHFQNQTGSSQASLHIRAGNNNSPVAVVLGSWLHSELPTGGSLDITSLIAYLNSSTDAPDFVFEIIRSSPTMLVLILDLPARKDLVLWPDYLKTFYEDTQLDTHRQALERLPEVQPYFSSSLYIRTIFSSPTAITVRIQTENGGAERMEEIIRDHLDPISKQVLGIWLDYCVSAKREVGEEERACLKKRDGLARKQSIEVDLGSSFPRLFGPEVGNRVLQAIKEYCTV
ncbi:hypothetical protein RJT34_10746 [Clitoria ternatea]|uniref:Red chlorophyll catabolite reductase n=1 Tax=Clitoria ternatea TaxID=43366 RepID=A0AAN9JL34_CLITE